MPETTENTQAQNTPDAAENNTGAAAQSGAATEAETNQAQTEKTFTQADVDRIVQNRLKTAVKAELKKLTTDDADKPNVEELQRQLSDLTTKARQYETRDAVQRFLADAKNKVVVDTQNLPGAIELAMKFVEYDDDGNPSNVSEAIEQARKLAPKLYGSTTANINQGPSGSRPGLFDMNAQIRRAAGRQ